MGNLAASTCLTIWIAFQIWRGSAWCRTRFSRDSIQTIPQWVDRYEQPGLFWFLIVMESLIAGYLWFKALN